MRDVSLLSCFVLPASFFFNFGLFIIFSFTTVYMLNVSVFYSRMHQGIENSCSVLFVSILLHFLASLSHDQRGSIKKVAGELPAGVNLQIAWNNSSSSCKTLLHC